MDLTRLADQFPPDEIEWRIGRSGMKDGKPWATALAYVTNRAIMNRLDAVCTPAEWRNEYKEWNVGQNHGVLCGISIRSHVNETGWEWVTKWDGAENTDIESVKGGLSDAMKRAAVQWGIGRYLYNLEEAFVDCSTTKQAGWNFAKGTDRASKQDFTFYWKTPELPSWALPTKINAKASVGSVVTASPVTFTSLPEVLKAENTNVKPEDKPMSQDLYNSIISLCKQLEEDPEKIWGKYGTPDMITTKVAGGIVNALLKKRGAQVKANS